MGVTKRGAVSSFAAAAELAAKVTQETQGDVVRATSGLDAPIGTTPLPGVVDVVSPLATGGLCEHPRAYWRKVGLPPVAPDAIRADEDVHIWNVVRAELAVLRFKEQERRVLTMSQLSLLTTADAGTQVVRGINLRWDESSCAPGSA